MRIADGLMYICADVPTGIYLLIYQLYVDITKRKISGGEQVLTVFIVL